MRLAPPAVLIVLSLVLSCSVLASQNSQSQQATAEPLTNADVLDMLKAGLSQEIVIAKIKASACDFDTSPAALKTLKAAGVPDPVVLTMVEVPGRSPMPRTEESGKNQQDVQQQFDAKKREEIQKANDDLQDCQTYFQNDYNNRINVLGTLSLTPMMRVYAADRLKQNLDTELRQCRTQYEQRMAVIGGRTTVAPSLSTAPVATPPPPSAATSQTTTKLPGTISLTSNPDGAEVAVDNTIVGKTPMTLGLQPGQHTIGVLMAGYTKWVRRVTVEAGATLNITAALNKSN